MTTYKTPEYYARLKTWKRMHQEQIARLMAAAHEPLTEKDYDIRKMKWPEYREFQQCWCCGMELIKKQKDYCSGVCERMYSLYPSQFGLYRR